MKLHLTNDITALDPNGEYPETQWDSLMESYNAHQERVILAVYPEAQFEYQRATGGSWRLSDVDEPSDDLRFSLQSLMEDAFETYAWPDVEIGK